MLEYLIRIVRPRIANMIRVSLFATFVLACTAIGVTADTSAPASAVVTEIDRILTESWDRAGLSPAPTSSDAEFCRRVWLDLAGVAPSVSEVRQFLSEDRKDKRERLIDQLLESPQHADHMATRWTEILLPADGQNQFQQQANIAELHRWLREQFLDNTPYDHLVGRFLTAGGAGNRGPAIFYTTRGLEPKKVAAATSKVFMGIQLQCAECHNHPFDRWTQDDFWQYTAFFSQLKQSEQNMNQGGIIVDRVGSEVTFPDSEDVAQPRYPGVSEPPEKDPLGIRRRQLTIWLASRDNPYFARAAVNRVWAHLFGRGLVDPVDAMDEANKPSHPELLDYLANFFVQTRFDLRTLYATIARTRAYGLTSVSGGNESPPQDSFAAMSVKTLSAAQFYDSLQRNVFRQSSPIFSTSMSAAMATRNQFLNRMRTSNSSSRSYPLGVVQVLGIMNGPEIGLATDASQIGLLASLEAPFLSDVDRVELLFLSTLSRLPTANESTEFLKVLETADESLLARSDLLWVLLNTAECAVCP